MSNIYHITTGDNIKIEEVAAQLRSIKEFPVPIRIYDRIFMVNNKEEMFVAANAIKVGYYLCQEQNEKPQPKQVHGIH